MAETDLTIETMVYGGAGLAHSGGEAVFVPFTLPQERVRVEPVQRSAHHLNANLIEVLQPSADRIQPTCIHFGTCGGCHYQHAAYPAQVKIKQQILLDTLQRAHVLPPQTIQTHSADPWHYRNRIQLRAEKLDGILRLGYSQRGTHQFMPATMCPIAAKPLWAAAKIIEQLINADDMFLALPLCEVELFCGHEDTLQVSFYLDVSHSAMDRDTAAHFRRLCETLQKSVPQIEGAGVSVWSAPAEKASKHRTSLEVVRWGKPSTQYEISTSRGPLHFSIQRGGFFQVNRNLLSTLIHLVTNNRSGESAWDLYAGVGLFSQALASSFQSVTAVELGERSFESLSSMVAHLGKQHRAVHADTLAWLRGQGSRLAAPDLIVVDPPRAGLGKPVADLLAKTNAQQIVYVSCDPTTLSRDLKGLIESGYCLAELHLVDLFPQTFHLETVAVLTR